MKIDNEYIITALEKRNGYSFTVALSEDSASGGYVYWTDVLKSAKKFPSKEKAKEYFNCSFDISIGEHKDYNGEYEIIKPFEIQKIVTKFECCSDYESTDNGR